MKSNGMPVKGMQCIAIYLTNVLYFEMHVSTMSSLLQWSISVLVVCSRLRCGILKLMIRLELLPARM